MVATTTAPHATTTIHDFVSGTLYSVAKVAALFGKTGQWVRNKIAAKRLSAAKLDGLGPWLVSGESVRVLYGSLKLAEDVSGPPAREENEDAVIRRELARLAELNGKGKGRGEVKRAK